MKYSPQLLFLVATFHMTAILHAQEAMSLETIEAGETVPASAAPAVGVFYSVQNPSLPPMPGNFYNLPVWELGQDRYLLDDRDVDYSSSATGGRNFEPMDDPPSPGGTGGDGDGGSSFTPHSYSTNDLWLEITGYSNSMAYLTIHPPSSITNGVYGLYFETNLTVPAAWSWVLTSDAGQTNLVVTNLPGTNGFFSLGPATAIRPGFTQQSLGPSDDDYTGEGQSGTLLTNLNAAIGFTINYFGTLQSDLWVNNNGNVTFSNLLSDFTPTNLSSLGVDIIAPFWADVDTRGYSNDVTSGVVSYGWETVNSRNAFGVDWPGVGYFEQEVDKTNTFQLLLLDRSDRGTGDFDIEFNYSEIQWDTGDDSGGIDGLYVTNIYNFGESARAGYATYRGTSFELNGSGWGEALLDTNLDTPGLIHSNLNSTVPGRYVFHFHNGTNMDTP
ncbi:MAG TPA: nidogen-like domain-containing protein [Verrucomicrobiae bacterium]|nr:nidogen-like domain-containing protein [Verrucomicrobiae bacterium]